MIAGRVSVVVPLYNGEDFVEDALQGLAEQTHPDVEVIVIDDGSTDGSGTTVQRHTDVRYVRQDNTGQVEARRVGLHLATGEFIAFNDHDDVMLPARLARQVHHLRVHPDTAAVLCRHEAVTTGDASELPDWIPTDEVFGDLGGVEWASMLARTALMEDEFFRTDARMADGIRILAGLRDRGHTVDVLEEKLWLRRYHDRNMTQDREVLRHDLLAFLHRRVRADGGER